MVFYLAWMKHPFPVTAASDGRSIVVNSTSGTLDDKIHDLTTFF